MSDILKAIDESTSILLLTHENPDGDAVGSLMAMYYALCNMNKKVDFIIQDIPPIFSFLNSINNTIKKTNKQYDLAITVDCATKERIGQCNDEFSRCYKSIVIDHHASNTMYGDINYVYGDVSSCAQVIYYLFKKLNIEIDKNIGCALVTGCITDTGGFANNNVDKDTFLMVSDLIELGVDFHDIYYRVLSMKNKAQYLLTKLTFDRLELLYDGKIAFSYISKKDFENTGAKFGDHEGLVNIGRNIEGVEVSIFVREDDGYRISFRSSGNFFVDNIAAKFGGGGHKMAAGAKINIDFDELKRRLISETIKELEK